MSKRILVTGGAGFIGTHLCKKLAERHQGEDEILIVDNFYTSRRGLPFKALLNYHNVEFIRHDVTLPLYVEIEEIYNLACPASPIHYQRDPVQTMKTNVLGAINMLGVAKRTGAKIVQASTSEVYGDPEVHPQTEDYWGNVNPIGLRSCYDEGKRCAETLFFDYRRQHNVDARVVRLFNTYGPNMQPNDGRVVSNFIVQALRHDALTVYGDGSQTRSFCYVSDTVKGLIAAMEVASLPAPVNLGNPTETDMKELARTVLKLTNSKSKIIYEVLPQDDPKRRRPDISMAKRLLHWEPVVSLEEGLFETVRYFKAVDFGWR
jgi:UDP-glucuronate decarboxylase